MRSQTLAHPGWRGNGIASQAWWKHASFVRLGPDTTFADAAHTLDAMAEAGVDSMILPDLQPGPDAALPFSESFGTEDDLDALLREASARRMHVLLTMPVARLSAGSGEVRFWMSRGIGGFDVGSVSPGDMSVLRGVRSAMARFPGERILLAHTAPDSRTPQNRRRDPIALHLSDSEKAREAVPSQPSAIEISDAEDLDAWIRGTRPVFDEAFVRGDEGRKQIRNALTERASNRARASNRPRRP